MSRSGRTATTITTLLLLLAAPAGAGSGSLDPAALPRGADLTRPYVEGATIVDGTRTVDVPDSQDLEILGVAPTGWLVSKSRTFFDLAFVAVDGTQRRLPGADEDTVFSPDGRFYTAAGLLSDGETQVGVRRLSDGKRLASRVFRSWIDTNVGRFARPVDLDGDRMLIGGSGGRVMVWNWRRDTLRTVKDDKWHLQAGSLRRDIAAGFTAPGERCTFVARPSRPRRDLWRSCSQRVLSFSPDGRRMMTIDRRITPGFDKAREMVMRKVTGKTLGRWRAESFTDIAWENDTTISFRVDGASLTSMVRCSASRCANASDPIPVD